MMAGDKRKRRLSKRERKNLKRIKKSNNDDDVTASSSSAPPSSKANVEWTLDEYMVGYNPTPKLLKDDSSNYANDTNDDNVKSSSSLGKWFPRAAVIKSSICYTNDYLAKLAKERRSKKNDTTEEKIVVEEEPKSSLVLFYQYVSPPWSPAKVASILAYLTNVAGHRNNIGGRIRVSTEGVNATVSAASVSVESDAAVGREGATRSDDNPAAFRAAQTLRHFAEDLRHFDPFAFATTDFKYVDNLTADRHFKELKLIPVKELVFYGIREEDVASDKGNGGGVHLDPTAYHEMLKRDDAVVIDVRNHYEAAIGRFEGQMEGSCGTKDGDNDCKVGGATYINPKMRKSTDFTSWLQQPETKHKLEGKTVMMFCTGGIRCERASAYLNTQMGSDVKGIYQLKGGVERYLKDFPEGGFWRGKNFVFDKREAISPGNMNGDGGCLLKEKKSKEDVTLSWGECAKCNKSWDRYIGKRKCFTCGVPILVCDTCMSSKTEERENIRCPLCIEENITIPVQEVEYTDNGVRGKLISSSFNHDGETEESFGIDEKAARSVLKWGGGHAKQKKEKRKLSKRLCQFGTECVRKDCFFYHPGR